MTAKPEHYEVIRKPIITEKATLASENGAVVFQVAMDSTKPEIKAAVELLFKVEVEGVQVANVKGKSKRFKGMAGRRKGWKKAFVSLKPGQEINFVEGGNA